MDQAEKSRILKSLYDAVMAANVLGGALQKAREALKQLSVHETHEKPPATRKQKCPFLGLMVERCEVMDNIQGGICGDIEKNATNAAAFCRQTIVRHTTVGGHLSETMRTADVLVETIKKARGHLKNG